MTSWRQTALYGWRMDFGAIGLGSDSRSVRPSPPALSRGVRAHKPALSRVGFLHCCRRWRSGAPSGASGTETATAQFLRVPTIAGLVLYMVSAVLYVVALRKMTISVAFPTVSLAYVLIAVIDHFVFKSSWA